MFGGVGVGGGSGLQDMGRGGGGGGGVIEACLGEMEAEERAENDRHNDCCRIEASPKGSRYSRLFPASISTRISRCPV
jgi:hypothetical protein